MKFERVISRAWYGNQAWIKALSPLSKLYFRVAEKRKRKAEANRRQPFVVPVIVVGNITLGGTGKTPLIVYLANQLQAKGVPVGVVSRGYGANPPGYPYLVKSGDRPEVCGDEPLLIAESTGVPVVIDPDRCAAAETLLRQGVSMILSDDGLQHYALPREYEILVIDAERGFGNGLLLPAGPLRELPERLKSVDFVISNGAKGLLDPEITVDASFQLRPESWVNVLTGTRVPLDFLPKDGEFDAVAGIGNPGRFFATLRNMGLNVREHVFPDHHQFSKKDFGFLNSLSDDTVFMTRKDALKCRTIAGPNFWALDIDLEFDSSIELGDMGLALVNEILSLRDY